MKILLIFIVCTTTSISTNQLLYNKIQNTHSLFTQDQKQLLISILQTMYATNPYLQACAADFVTHSLQKNIALKEKALTQAHEYEKPLIQHNMDIYTLQKEQLEAYARTYFYHTPWYKKLFYQCMQLPTTMLEYCAHLLHMSYQSPLTYTINALQEYITLEHAIFENYQQTQFFIALQSLHTFPEILQFWNHPQVRVALLQEIKKYALQPEVQAALEEATNAVEEAEKIGAAAENTDAALAAEGQAGQKAEQVLESAKNDLEKTTGETGEQTAAQDIKNALEENKPEESQTIQETPSQEAFENAFQELEQKLGRIQQELEAVLSTTTPEEMYQLTIKSIEQFSTQQEEALSALNQQLAADKEIVEGNQAIIDDKNASTVAKQAAKKAIQKTIKSQAEFYKAANASLKNIQEEVAANRSLILKNLDAYTGKDSLEQLEAFSKQLQEQIQSLSHNIPSSAFESGAHMVMEMTAQMLIMQGGSLAMQWTNAEDAQKMAQLMQQQATIQGSFTAQQSQIQATLLSQEKAVEQAGTSAISAILNSKSNSQTTLTQQQTYLQQATVTPNMYSIAFTNPFTADSNSQSVAEIDQNFYVSSMLTPAIPSRTTTQLSAQDALEKLWHITTRPFPQLIKTPWHTWQAASPKFITSQWIINTDQSAPQQSINQITQSNTNNTSNLLLPPSQTTTNPYGHLWYNLYRIGNWQFNYATQSFYQYQAVPIPLYNNISGFYNCLAGGAYNSIFTEYIPPVSHNTNNIPSYEIEIEVEVYTAHYPFFAGVLFNGARWISGVLSPLDQNRLIGLYGTPDGSIALTCAETFYIQSSSQNLQNIQAISPLMQIMTTFEQWKDTSNNTSTQKALTWNQINSSWQKVSQQTAIQNPLYSPSQTTKSSKNQTTLKLNTPYIISIITQSDAFMITLYAKNNTTQTAGSNNQNIIAGPFVFNNRNPLVGIYHSLGFVAPGCSARFSIIKPQQLMYSQTAIQDFEQSLKNQDTQSSGGQS